MCTVKHKIRVGSASAPNDIHISHTQTHCFTHPVSVDGILHVVDIMSAFLRMFFFWINVGGIGSGDRFSSEDPCFD